MEIPQVHLWPGISWWHGRIRSYSGILSFDRKQCNSFSVRTQNFD